MTSALPSLLVCAALSAACNAPNAGDDAAAQPDASTPNDGATPADSSSSLDGARPDVAAQLDTGPAADVPSSEHPTTIGTGVCFSFATGTGSAANPCTADLFTLSGSRVDLGVGDRSAGLCLLPGTHPNLAAVPRDYAACNWSEYVEGGPSLANQGILVRGVGGTHHYRMWIQSNTQPSLVFRWDAID
jgi:hypothetical protein